LRLAKSVLGSLGCKAGKSTKAHSKAVPKGQVISTSPGPGTYAANTVIALKVSSGPPPRKHKPTKR
jgi:beta-lactam-binding protein with PASTA domain